MKSVVVRDLRNKFSKVEAWQGEGAWIEKRGQPGGFILALPKPAKGELGKVD